MDPSRCTVLDSRVRGNDARGAGLARGAGRARGFTLIEAVIAITILTVAVPPMLWAVRQAHTQRVSPMKASIARWLVIEKLEDIIADRHSTTRGYTYLVTGNYAAENPVTGFTGYTRSVAFATTAVDLSSAGSGYRKVTVTVGWTDATGTARSLAISTIVTDY